MKELDIATADYTIPSESEDKELNNKIGEEVKIKSIKKDGMQPEDYYYLKQFENKTGTIAEQNRCQSGKYTYKIEFDQNHFGYFYQEDFILINEDKPI